MRNVNSGYLFGMNCLVAGVCCCVKKKKFSSLLQDSCFFSIAFVPYFKFSDSQALKNCTFSKSLEIVWGKFINNYGYVK